MNSRISEINIDGARFRYEHIDECPHCGVPQKTEIVRQAKVALSEAEYAYIISFTCTMHNCRKLFFTCNYATLKTGPDYWAQQLLLIHPSPHAGQELKRIETISPNAVKTYNQATEAKMRGLSELTGMGIRKSLEYLLHDFGERYYPESSDFNNNPNTTFAQRIGKFIESTEIRELATACAWLGNDCTHPIRRHTEKDVSDLERFAKALFYHINMVYEARNALEELKQPKPQ